MIVIRDPIYRLIEIEDEFLFVIDNPYFQRLRRIKQNANLFSVYPSAKHDRFCHSLGVYHLMKQITNRLDISEEDAYNLKAAALLHDIGHGPYSHFWERVTGFNHEEFSQKIIREIFNLPEVASIVAKKHPLYPLLSSVLDVDRLDYMARDSYFCGVGYGDTDVDRIVNNMYARDGKIIIPPKIVPSVEHVITGRASLYKSTYYHHSVRGMDMLLLSIFKRAKVVGEFYDDVMRKGFFGEVSTKDFLLLDDALIEYHLNKWRSSEDLVLHDLVDRYFSRKSFGTLNVHHYDVDKDKLLLQVSEKFNPNYYYKYDVVTKDVYGDEIYVQKGDKLIPLSSFSTFISQIANTPIHEEFVIAPKEFTKEIKNRHRIVK